MQHQDDMPALDPGSPARDPSTPPPRKRGRDVETPTEDVPTPKAEGKRQRLGLRRSAGLLHFMDLYHLQDKRNRQVGEDPVLGAKLAPGASFIDKKMVDLDILDDVLNNWVVRDADALSFALMDRTTTFSLMHRYRVRFNRSMDEVYRERVIRDYDDSVRRGIYPDEVSREADLNRGLFEEKVEFVIRKRMGLWLPSEDNQWDIAVGSAMPVVQDPRDDRVARIAQLMAAPKAEMVQKAPWAGPRSAYSTAFNRLTPRFRRVTSTNRAFFDKLSTDMLRKFDRFVFGVHTFDRKEFGTIDVDYLDYSRATQMSGGPELFVGRSMFHLVHLHLSPSTHTLALSKLPPSVQSLVATADHIMIEEEPPARVVNTHLKSCLLRLGTPLTRHLLPALRSVVRLELHPPYDIFLAPFSEPLGLRLPESLAELVIKGRFRPSPAFASFLPASLRRLCIDNLVGVIPEGALPENLEYLNIESPMFSLSNVIRSPPFPCFSCPARLKTLNLASRGHETDVAFAATDLSAAIAPAFAAIESIDLHYSGPVDMKGFVMPPKLRRLRVGALWFVNVPPFDADHFCVELREGTLTFTEHRVFKADLIVHRRRRPQAEQACVCAEGEEEEEEEEGAEGK